MAMRLLSFAIWAVVAASAVFWLMRLLARPDAAPPHTVTVAANTQVAAADLSRLLGSTRAAAAETAAEPPPDARFKLIGVVAPKTDARSGGLALIAIDGKPPRPVSLGGTVDGSLVLLAVNHRRAELGPAGGNATVRLELPAVPEANRSMRPPGATVGAAPSPPPPLPAMPTQVPPPAGATPGAPPTPVQGSRGTPNLTR